MSPVRASFLLLLAALCWGSGNVANKTVLDDLDPLTVVGLRCLLAALVIAPFALTDLRGLRDRSAWPSLMATSFLFTCALVLQQVAYLTTSVTNASFLVNTATIMTPILVWALLGQRPGLAIVVAAPVTLVGAFLMAGAGFSLQAVTSGDLVCLASALAYAGWMVALGRHAVRFGKPLGTAAVQFGMAAVVVLPLGLITEAPRIADFGPALPELVMLGVVSTAVAFALQTWAQRFVATSTAAVLVSAESIFGALGAFLLLGERSPALALAGAALILIAICMVAFASAAPDQSGGAAGRMQVSLRTARQDRHRPASSPR